nr:hypothetical protein [Paenibacillus sp. WQ 127069]
MSFAGEENSAALKEAMQLAAANGILLIAAIGNDGKSSVLALEFVCECTSFFGHSVVSLLVYWLYSKPNDFTVK